MRGFQVGDGPSVVALWQRSAPTDAITADRFRNLVLLDANFDPSGLRVAVAGGELVGIAYAVRRRVAMVGADLEPRTGWLPFFFVAPEARGHGVGRAVVTSALDWLRGHGVTEAYVSCYTPNYVLPGLDAATYPEARRLLASLGFSRHSEVDAMDRSLVGYAIPESVRDRMGTLERAGYRIGTPRADDLVDLVRLAGEEFSADWAREIRESVVAGMPLERIVGAWEPDGTLVGWAMHGGYENAVERFGPFGVLADRRGQGLGTVLLHLTLERMRALGAHGAWFLWTEPDSPAARLYRAAGFTTTRSFELLRVDLAG